MTLPTLTLTEASKRLGISRQRAHQLLQAGKIEGKHVRKGPLSYWVITERALDEYLDRKKKIRR